LSEEEATLFLQSIIRGYYSRKEYIRRDNRRKVVQEILVTEEEYVRRLRLIRELYLNPLQKEPHKYGITQGDINSIFVPTCIDTMLGYHGAIFLVQLLHLIGDGWHPSQKLGSLFPELVREEEQDENNIHFCFIG